jgi:hypothetical protein
MNKADISLNEKKYKRSIAVLVIIAILSAILSASPQIQNRVKSFFARDIRLILTKIRTFYGADQTEYLILKIKDSTGIQIEIYEVKSETQKNFKQKFELTQDSDAYITIDKNTTNLALSDIDKDNQLDIVAPSADRNGNLRLNVFRFNAELNSFEPLLEETN